MFRFAIWTSGDHDALELISRIHHAVVTPQAAGIPSADISAIVCNRVRGEDAEADDFLNWCDSQDLDVISVSSRQLRHAHPQTWRKELGERFRELLSPYQAEVHLLVGYMLWADDATATQLRLLNLHPALPGGPAGSWQQVIRAIQTQGASEHGATMQLVRAGRENRDRGAALTFFRFPLRSEMGFDEIRAAGFRREPVLLLATLRALASGELHLCEGPARDLTRAVDAEISQTEAADEGVNRRPLPPTPCIFFDLEGPLSPQDNAYEVMGLIPRGHELFAVISRYDDLLALEEKPGYEPGDTLALILPFLAAHGLTADDVRSVSRRARLIAGARGLLARLQHGEGFGGEGPWRTHIISTSYAPHALRIATALGVPADRVACTPFPAVGYHSRLDQSTLALVHGMEARILSLSPPGDDEAIQSLLDRFYWQDLAASPWGDPLDATRVMGGRRKAEAAGQFAEASGMTLAESVAIGDSITDTAMLRAVDRAGGLALAFNANDYALSQATAAVASTTLQDLAPLLSAWVQGGRSAVESICARRLSADWLGSRSGIPPEVSERHRTARQAVRGQAAGLG